MNMKSRNIYIDFMKGTAIICVILYHIGLMKYGYLGVDIFLVINGFLIVRSLEKACSKEGFSFWKFIVQRLNRLWPLVILMGAIALGLGYFTMLPDDYENLCETIVASNLFANNILQAITTKNYWDVVQTFKPLMHTWYLGILLQFYIFCLPIIMLLRKVSKNKKRNTFVGLVILTVISFGLYLFTGNVAQKFYYLPFRLWELGIGGLISYLPDKFKMPKQMTNKRLPFLFYGLIVLQLILLGVNYDLLPNEVRLITVAVETVVTILLSIKMESIAFPSLCKIVSFIGMSSYSLYIWHQFIFAFWKYIIDASMNSWSILACLALAVGFGIFSYFAVERNILHGGETVYCYKSNMHCDYGA